MNIPRNLQISILSKLLIFIVLCCLTLATFWTFPLDRNRILIGLFNMAIGVAWLAYMRARLPGAGGQIPMIGNLILVFLKKTEDRNS